MSKTKILTLILGVFLASLFLGSNSANADVISIEPTQLDFGKINIGGQDQKKVEITNTSGSVIQITYENDNPNDFEVEPTPSNIPAIPADGKAIFTITFKSAEPEGVKNGIINIIDSKDKLLGVVLLSAVAAVPSSDGNDSDISLRFPNPLGDSTTTVVDVVKNIINGIFGLLGAIAVGIIVYGGVLYMTAGASKDGTEKAKKIITSAAIGLIIALLSLAIVDLLFVLLGGR